ncbi:hypothetical protein EVAR_89588_1 [Eumeta japonica]|uniref:Uncharacterized protein n=1 Tax=Eumeta variegata TaxID=151549 RepID=A0A4C1XNG0_EUMVA|nr:hypothetical protein EVAR_89588_1 [Eumeta japonica]
MDNLIHAQYTDGWKFKSKSGSGPAPFPASAAPAAPPPPRDRAKDSFQFSMAQRTRPMCALGSAVACRPRVRLRMAHSPSITPFPLHYNTLPLSPHTPHHRHILSIIRHSISTQVGNALRPQASAGGRRPPPTPWWFACWFALCTLCYNNETFCLNEFSLAKTLTSTIFNLKF